MSPARRFMFAGFAVAAVEVALGIVALRTEIAPYFFLCAAASVALGIGARRLLVRPDDGDDPGDGGTRRPPDEPPPPWWPEFEREFRAHVRERERPRQPVH